MMTSENNQYAPQRPVHEEQIPPLSEYARAIIKRHDLVPHPEGGWYSRTWQSPLEYKNSTRPLASLIYFLLPKGDFSDWHLVDADELWLWHGPSPLEIEVSDTDPRKSVEGFAKKSTVTRLGDGLDSRNITTDTNKGYIATFAAQTLIRAGQWQRTLPAENDVLVSCVVSPGFTFEGFTVISE